MATTYTAYSVYYYDYNQEPAVGYGMAGRIRDNGSTAAASPNLQTGLNGDPKVEGFISGSDLRIAVTQYDYINEPPVAQPVKVYNAITPASPAPVTQTWAK